MSGLAAGGRPWTGIRSPVLAGLMGLAIAIWPWYLFPPGYPQPITLLLCLAFLVVFLRCPSAVLGSLRQPEVGLIALFFAYTLVVNLTFAAAYQDLEPLQHSMFYLQVVFGCVAFRELLRTEPLAPRIIALAVAAALVVQVATLVLSAPSASARATLLFSNPNQLGFFGLLALAFLLLTHRFARLPALLTLGGAAIAFLMIALSLSKASIVAGMGMLYLYILLAPMQDSRLRRLRPLLIVVIPAVLLVAAFVWREQVQVVNALMDRLAQIGESSDDSVSGRHYARIVLWPQYLFLGAGEGLYGRWDVPREIHSMFGTLVFSYGLPGLAIVLALLAVVFRRNPRDFLIYLFPVLLYGLTHHPMRQPMMWALVIAVSHFGGAASRRAGG